jgi:hypothetical protein
MYLYSKKCLLIIFTIISSTLLISSSTNLKVIPTPQETYWGEKIWEIGHNSYFNCHIELLGDAKNIKILPNEIYKRLENRFGVKPTKSQNKIVKLIFALDVKDIPLNCEKMEKDLKDLNEEGYVLRTYKNNGKKYIIIVGNSSSALWHGMATFTQLLTYKQGTLFFPEIEIVDYPIMSDRGLLVDLGGQGYMVGPSRWNFQQWKEYIDWMVDHKLNFIFLEFIGSGKLMSNLDMEKNEWCGFPIDLKSYPEMVCKNRPIRRWDTKQQKVIDDYYTAPNVKDEFVGNLIEYAKQRGVRPYLLIGYDYFAKQLPVVLGLPAGDPTHPEANKFYDNVLREITTKYKNSCGVVLCTIEDHQAPPEMIQTIIKRTNDAYNIIKNINPEMEVYIFADYIKWQKNDLEQLSLLRKNTPEDVGMVYSPHIQPQQKAWQRVFGNIWKYTNYTQYAWDHIVYIFPERAQQEISHVYADGYRRFVSQAWTFDVCSINLMALAEYSWNLTSCPVSEFWDKSVEKTFGLDAKEQMITALKHTRFDRRFDVIMRQILADKIYEEFPYWDMYVQHNYVITEEFIKDLKDDAYQSLTAAQSALPHARKSSKFMVEMTITSAKRRLYLATSTLSLLKALEFQKEGKNKEACEQMDYCLQEANKLLMASKNLGIEYPMTVHDDEFVEKLHQYREKICIK